MACKVRACCRAIGGMEHFGAAIPQGRRLAIAYLTRFIEEARFDVTVQRAIARANLRGTVPDHASGSTQQ